MKHDWEYEESEKPPRRRTCALCGATGRKNGYQGTWATLLPGATGESSGPTLCPGRPLAQAVDR